MINLERQSGLIPSEAIGRTTADIVGAGAIGSHTAEYFAKIGIRTMRIWDFDFVEDHNLANQGYRLSDLDKSKVSALCSRLNADYGTDATPKQVKVTSSTQLSSKFIVSAVDNMSAREEIWSVARRSLTSEYLIDARMGAMYGQIYVVDLSSQNSCNQYKESLFKDEEGYQAPCTEKATVFCAAGMASWITSTLASVVTSGKAPHFSLIEVDYARNEFFKY